jgi:hypothetical protein
VPSSLPAELAHATNPHQKNFIPENKKSIILGQTTVRGSPTGFSANSFLVLFLPCVLVYNNNWLTDKLNSHSAWTREEQLRLKEKKRSEKKELQKGTHILVDTFQPLQEAAAVVFLVAAAAALSLSLTHSLTAGFYKAENWLAIVSGVVVSELLLLLTSAPDSGRCLLLLSLASTAVQ